MEIWNSFAGVALFTDLKALKKFTSRKDAVARIWSAVERLAPLVTGPAPDVAPVRGKRDQDARKQKRRDTPRAAAKEKENVARDGSKAATILELLKRPGGVTSKELMKAIGWQPDGFQSRPFRAAEFTPGGAVRSGGFAVPPTSPTAPGTARPDRDGLSESGLR